MQGRSIFGWGVLGEPRSLAEKVLENSPREEIHSCDERILPMPLGVEECGSYLPNVFAREVLRAKLRTKREFAESFLDFILFY